MQFEPESFVDGLLGIGIAGGGAAKEEGRALASRLTEMRKERNERAKTTSATKKKESSSSGGAAGQMTLQGLDGIGDIEAMSSEFMGAEDMGEMELITPGGGDGGGSSRGKSKNKNKKKKKRKKK